MDSASHIERIKADGFTIVERAIEPELVEALAKALDRHERELGVSPP